MGPKFFGGQNLCLPKICLTQNIGVRLELKESLELECGPAQPNLLLIVNCLVLFNKNKQKWK